ncbi:MAG: cupredoxin domain-containing protein [Thermomicrobiales bacterium]|nr:cupredoxin domain-containing protein [Thermomicrobiales bacterium]
MLRRIGSFVALLLVATLVLAACGSEDDDVEPTVTRMAVEGAPTGETPEAGGATTGAAAESPAASSEPAAGAMTIDVEMVDIAFAPTEITVPANTDVTINLVNNGVSTHNFHIDELGVNSGDYAGGQTGTVTFNSGAPGEYEFFCSVPGHKEAGMVGKLIVTGETGGGDATAQESTPASEASPPAETTDAAGDTAPPAADVQTTFDVEMVDIAFEPTELTVPANTDITINLVNNGVAVHNFHIAELGVESGDYAGGQTGTVTFNSGAPGEYEFFCAVPGHREAGMVGKLIVVAADGAAAAADEGAPADEGTAAAETTDEPAQAAAAGAPMTVDVEMVDIAFEPNEITVPANTEITINLVNNGVAVHNFHIDELGVNSGDYAGGQTGTVTFNSGAPGEYEFFCAVPGHREAGMVGKLIVTAAAEEAPVAEASPAASPVASPVAATPEAAGPTTVDVEMVDIAFEPTEITVPANSEITINLVNNGVAVHNFHIDELGVNSGDYVSGQTGTVTFNSGAPGEYTFYCAVPGHREAGMVGTIIVQ